MCVKDSDTVKVHFCRCVCVTSHSYSIRNIFNMNTISQTAGSKFHSNFLRQDFFLITSAVHMSCKYSVNVISLHNPLHISSDRRNILTFMALSYCHQHNNNDGLSCRSLSFFFPPRWENGPRGLVFLPLLLSLEWAGFALFSAWYTVHRVM